MRCILLSVMLQFFLLSLAYGGSHIAPNPGPIGTTAFCSCAASASLYGDQIITIPPVSPSLLTGPPKTANNTVELSSSGFGVGFNIDFQPSSILITTPAGVILPNNSSFKFKDINPQFTGNCSGNMAIVDINVSTSSPSLNWVSGNVSFSEDEIVIPTAQSNGNYTWSAGDWIKVDLVYNCVTPPKRGMTWGFAGFSDIRYYNTQNCNWNTARLACETYPVNSPQSNHCGHSYSFPNASPSVWETPITGSVTTNPPIGNGTRKCDPVNGDTACSEKRHVLCVAEVNNPYFKRQHPYDGSPLTGYPSNINLIPFVRPRYEIHAAPVGGQPAEYSEGWVDQHVKLSRDEVSGASLGSVADGDAACGAGWRMASFDDGKWVQGMGLNTAYGNLWPSAPKQSGGWAFHANLAPDDNKGSLTHHGDSGMNARWRFVNKRYWVNSNQGGNCWD